MNGELPALRPRTVLRVLQRAGLVVEQQTEEHMTLRDVTSGNTVTVAIRNRDLKRTTLATIIRSSGLTREEFLSLL